jgi:hypothetical protein
MPRRHRADRPKKRKFHGNRFTGPVEPPQTSGKRKAEMMSPNASFLKLMPNLKSARVETSGIEGNRIVDVSLLISLFEELACPTCGSGLSVEDEVLVGLASKLRIVCEQCDFKKDFSTSKAIAGGKVFAVNRQFTVAMCAIGKHHQQASRFATNMDLPPPVSEVSWRKHVNEIHRVTRTVSECSMRRAANQIRDSLPTSNATVSCDGTWQRRGFSSLNGVSTVCSIGKDVSGLAAKVIDVEVLSNFCSKCVNMKKKLSEIEFTEWYKSHKSSCSKNHTGSAGAMEQAGMLSIFQRSVKTRKLQYTGYLGDGDSKAYKTVSNAKIYKDKIQKLECCGHVQKRMGKRLMDKVHELKGKKFIECGKTYTGIGGIGRLTQKAIQRIQGHYGAAIRQNPGDVKGMKKSIWAIWKHRSNDHSDCKNWCPVMAGTGPAKNILPDFVCKAIRPVFEHLSSEELLSKCAHGGTQNPNESFHHLIWERCPKNIFVGRTRLQLSVYDAAIVYNEGELGRLPVFDALNLSRSSHLRRGLIAIDSNRVKQGYVPGQKLVLNNRRIRSLKAKNQKNDLSYDAGNF